MGSYDNNVYALNATTGAKVWSYTAGGCVESSPAVADGVIYVGGDDYKLYAIGTAATTIQAVTIQAVTSQGTTRGFAITLLL